MPWSENILVAERTRTYGSQSAAGLTTKFIRQNKFSKGVGCHPQNGSWGVPAGGPLENPRSLSRPKLELWPKMSKKVGKWGGVLSELGVEWVAGGGPGENPRSLSSPKLAQWFDTKFGQI